MRKLLKKIYVSLPYKQPLLTVLRSIWSPPERIYRHLTFRGPIRVPVDKAISFRMHHFGFWLEHQLFWKGLYGDGWEKESIKLWVALCRHSNTIFDVGANTGVYALIAKAVNPTAKVYAFEPVHRIYENLQSNIRLNNYDILALEAAASNVNGEAVIYDMPNDHVYSVTVNQNLRDASYDVVETKIKTMTLDSLIRKQGIEGIDLMKIDVETHEPEVLEGFREHLERYRPTMLIEILNEDIGRRVEALVEGLGYQYYNIDERTTIRRVDNIYKSDDFNYLICNPRHAAALKLP